jgi:RNA polymerase sigma-70 factor (ECF subfamily)
MKMRIYCARFSAVPRKIKCRLEAITWKVVTGRQGMAVSAEFVAQITKSQRQLHAFILSMVWNAAEADDVLQETNLVLWEKVAEFDASRPFLPWAMRFAQWQALAWLKRHKRQRLVFDDDLAKLLADEAAMAEPVFDARRVALASCFQKLKPEQRKLIARRYEPEASVNAMAEAAGTTAKAISDRLRRIRNALLECIEKTIAEGAFA